MQNRKDGKRIFVQTTLSSIKGKEGVHIGLVGVNRDFTKRKQTEEELKIKDSAIASSISAIGIADLEGTMMYVNDSLVEMWGYESADEILGRNVG